MTISAQAIGMPMQISGLVAWFKASDPANNGSQPADSSSVEDWIDKGPFHYSVTQATGGSQPVFDATAHNSLPGIVFDGTKYMVSGINLAQIVGNPNFDVILVHSASTDSGDSGGIFAGWGTTGTNGYSYMIGANGTTTDSAYLGWYGGGETTTIGSAYQIHEHVRTGSGDSVTGNEFYLNGVSTGLSAGSTITPNIQSDLFSIGGYQDGSLLSVTTISEICIYKRLLTSSEREALTISMCNEWGLTNFYF